MINKTWHSALCILEANASCWNDEVHRLNDEFSFMMSPVVVLMVTLMVIGLAGNTLVLLVYGHRHDRTTAQIFIMYLASTDLLACILIHPYVIYKLFHNYNQTWTAVCKMFEFTIHASLTISAVTLLAIAVDRYLAICRPIKFLDFHKHIYKIIFGTFAFGTLGSIPLLVWYGARAEEVIIGDHIFVGYKCDYTEEYNGSAMFGYSIFVVSCFLLEIIGIIVLYKNVAVVAFRSKRRVKPITVEPSDGIPMSGIRTGLSKTSNGGTRSTRLSTVDSTSTKSFNQDNSSTNISSLAKGAPKTPIPGSSSCKEPSIEEIVRTLTFPQSYISGSQKLDFRINASPGPSHKLITHEPSAQSKTAVRNVLTVPIRHITETSSSPRQASSGRQTVPRNLSALDNIDSSRQIQRLDRTKNLSSGLKAAKILFLVTAVFVFSWLPFFVLRMLYAIGILSPVDRSLRRQVFEHFLNHCFYINNAANPLIYSMINQNFRQECWNRLKRIFGFKNRNN